MRVKISNYVSPEAYLSDWKMYFFGIGQANFETNATSSNLIYPLSLFGIVWIILTALFLGACIQGMLCFWMD